MIKRAYRYRFYPTPEQIIILDRVFGCCRFVFNHFLQEKQKVWKEEARTLSYGDCSEGLKSLKETLLWLKEVSSVPLQQALRHLDKAYKGFFNKVAQFPKFKKKHAQQSATYMKNAFTYRQGEILLAKDSTPYFPSSKKCFPCGAINHGLTLKERTWQCPSCKAVLDRDINSGNCLDEEGLTLSKTIPWGSRNFKPVEMV